MIKTLMEHDAMFGQVVWMGVRTQKKAPLENCYHLAVSPDFGLFGDHYSGRSKKRQVTLIQAEHIAALSSFLGAEINPEQLRRNIVVEGINLLSFSKKRFEIGSVTFQMTGLCHPCSRMEQVLGLGGYNAMRGHGGITARVLTEGNIKEGDMVRSIPEEA